MKPMMRIGSLVSFLLAFSVATGSAEPLFAKLGTMTAPGQPATRSLRVFQALVQADIPEQLAIQVFPDGQLGTLPKLLEGLQFGDIEMALISSELLAAYSPELSALLMPYLFRDAEHRAHVLQGPVGGQVLAALDRQDMVGLSFLEAGHRHVVTTQHPVETPRDLQDLHLGQVLACPELECRSFIVQHWAEMFRQMGATIEPLRAEEICARFQAEKLDGWEGKSLSCLAHLEGEEDSPAIFVTTAGHIAVPDVLVASKRWFETLAPELQEALYRNASLFVEAHRQQWSAFAQRQQARLEERGVIFRPSDRTAFEAAVQRLYTQAYKKFGPEFEALIQTIRQVQ